MPMCSSFFGALIISIPMQYLGRKKALIGHYFFYIFGSLILGLTYFGKHKAMLYVGRLLQGLGVGCTTPACQIYVMTPPIALNLRELINDPLLIGKR